MTVWPGDATSTGAWRTGDGGPGNPQELNRYSYGLNNPLRYTDPSGHTPWILAAAGIGAAINVGAAVFSAAATGQLQQMSGREITGMVAGAAVSGAISGALSAVGGPIVSSLITGTAARVAGNLTFSVVGTAAAELAGSVTEGVVNAIYTPNPLQVEEPSLRGAVSDGAVGTAMSAIGYERAETLYDALRYGRNCSTMSLVTDALPDLRS